MNIPVTPLTWGVACLPILVLVVLMVKYKWGAAEAAPMGLLLTVISGMLVFRADLTLLATESAKGVWNALVIMLIVWTAILMYQVGDEAKAFSVIRSEMRKLLPNELLLVLAMGWIFESFLQGITGFGVPVAVGAPLLIGIGVKPIWAVVIPLLGQAWGNTFGTLAAAWDALAVSAGLEAGSAQYFLTALWAAAFLLLWNFVTGFSICWFYGKWRAIKKGMAAVLITVLIQTGGQLLLSQVNPTLACFLPSCIAMIAVIFVGKMKMYTEKWRMEDSPIMQREEAEEKEEELPQGMKLPHAFAPYAVLSLLTLGVLLIAPLHDILGSFVIAFSFPETRTGYGFVNGASKQFSPFSPFTHASMFLFISAALGLLYYRKKGWIHQEGVNRILMKSVSMTMPSGIAVIGLVIMSRIMGGSGQIMVLANGIAGVMGRTYLVLAPFVGLLGTFMTGSNMSSNILFGEFQSTSAALLRVSAPAVLGAHTTGGAAGSGLSPSKIILGTTTAGILGKEGEVMKIISAVALPLMLMIGLLLYLTAGV